MLFTGVLLSITASVLFGLLSYYSVLLSPLDGPSVFGWRIIFSLLIFALLVLFSRSSQRVWTDIRRLFGRPGNGFSTLLCSGLIAMQLALFGWAPMNGEGQALAMGYFLLPLLMVVIGRFLYHETIRPLQALAVTLALAGVLAGLILHGHFSPVSLIVMLGFPPYFMLRKRLALKGLSGIFIEHLVMLPPALIILFMWDFNADFFVAREASSWPVLIGLGLLSSTALFCYLGAGQRLPFALFGMLGYVEPLLLFVVALLLGEPFAAADLWMYVPIWLAVLLLVLHGVRQLGRQPRPALPRF
jgi:chloramphenicol-sensitive protein RarD